MAIHLILSDAWRIRECQYTQARDLAKIIWIHCHQCQAVLNSRGSYDCIGYSDGLANSLPIGDEIASPISNLTIQVVIHQP